MVIIASDDFSGTNGQELSAYNPLWKKVSGLSANAQIANGRARASTTASPVYYYDAAPASPDYSVSADFTRLSTAESDLGLIARASATENTHYRLVSAAGESRLYFGKFVSGAYTQMGLFEIGLTVGATVHVRLELLGTALSIYINGSTTPVQTYTDSSIQAAGYAGVRAFSRSVGDTVGSHLDNFTISTLGAPERQRSRLILTPW